MRIVISAWYIWPMIICINFQGIEPIDWLSVVKNLDMPNFLITTRSQLEALFACLDLSSGPLPPPIRPFLESWVHEESQVNGEIVFI